MTVGLALEIVAAIDKITADESARVLVCQSPAAGPAHPHGQHPRRCPAPPPVTHACGSNTVDDVAFGERPYLGGADESTALLTDVRRLTDAAAHPGPAGAHA